MDRISAPNSVLLLNLTFFNRNNTQQRTVIQRLIFDAFPTICVRKSSRSLSMFGPTLAMIKDSGGSLRSLAPLDIEQQHHAFQWLLQPILVVVGG